MPIAPGTPAPHQDNDERQARAVLYAFYKGSCPTCQLAFPVIAELERRYGDALPVVAVSQDPQPESAAWLADQGFAGRIIDDSAGFEMSHAYDIESVPTLVLVDATGVIASTSEAWDRDRYNGWASELGERTGRTTEPVSTESDGRPAFKPG